MAELPPSEVTFTWFVSYALKGDDLESFEELFTSEREAFAFAQALDGIGEEITITKVSMGGEFGDGEVAVLVTPPLCPMGGTPTPKCTTLVHGFGGDFGGGDAA